MATRTPLVSIVIPVYNGQEFLKDTLDSLITITYPTFEVLLIDDGSTDTSKKMCEEFSKLHSFARTLTQHANKGLADTLNFGIAQATGEYIARINQDDIIMPDRLTDQVAFLESHPDHVAIGSAIRMFDNEGRTIDNLTFPQTNEQIKKNWLIFSPFADPAVIYRKSAFLKTIGYEKSFWPVDDVHMWYKLGNIGKLANLSQVLTQVRWHTEAGSIKSHRIQVRRLFDLHMWANSNIRRANLIEWIFWISQLIAGYLFPPRFNWYVFRHLRKCSFRQIPN